MSRLIVSLPKIYNFTDKQKLQQRRLHNIRIRTKEWIECIGFYAITYKLAQQPHTLTKNKTTSTKTTTDETALTLEPTRERN